MKTKKELVKCEDQITLSSQTCESTGIRYCSDSCAGRGQEESCIFFYPDSKEIGCGYEETPPKNCPASQYDEVSVKVYM